MMDNDNIIVRIHFIDLYVKSKPEIYVTILS